MLEKARVPANQSGIRPQVRSFGWAEDEETVTFIYRDSRTSTKLVTFPRPKFKTQRVTDERTKRKVLKREYVIPSIIVDDLKMKSYMPACMYLSGKNIRNFKFLFARLCVKEDSNTGIISINPRRSS